MDANIFNKVRNGLTEYSKNYRSINPYMMMSYNGLPPYLCKLAHTIFFYIIKTKMYGAGAASKGKNEDKRIYTDIEITLDDLLLDFNPGKYDDGKDIEMDKSNIIKKIKEMDDYNVFYCWKYGKKYLFVMEREIGCWKIFYPNGHVVPKTLIKIVRLAGDMINCMVKLEGSHGKVDKISIEKSFGEFMNKMIQKMDASVCSKITLWSDDKEIEKYTAEVSKQLHGIGEFEGMGFSDERDSFKKESECFLNKIPATISKRMREEIRHEDMKSKKEKEMENDLLPKNPNLVSSAALKVKADKPIKNNSVTSIPKLYRWNGSLNPFANSLQFMKYYRSVLQNKSGGQIVFDTMDSDATMASQILDLMEERRRDKDFLDTWLQYFYEHNLKGQKAMKPKYTSLRCFKDTFENYNETFHVPN